MAKYVAYSKEITERICDRLADGESLRSICEDPSMPARKTVFEWLREDDDFLHRYQEARERQAEHYADQIIEIADTCTDALKARLQIDARKWVASKLAPKRYGDRVHPGTDGVGSLVITWASGEPIGEMKIIEHDAQPNLLPDVHD